MLQTAQYLRHNKQNYLAASYFFLSKKIFFRFNQLDFNSIESVDNFVFAGIFWLELGIELD